VVKIKICGLSRFEDIDAVNAAEPDYIGFVFTAKSRRYVTFSHAEQLSERLGSSIVPVGVFVNSPISDIIELYKSGVIKIAQLHGGEGEDYLSLLKAENVPIIQALRAGHGDIPSALADYYLFDGAVGGSGVANDWSSAPKTRKPLFLAGGITPENITHALALTPFAIDVSSGAETDGYKDSKKIRALVERVKIGENI